MMHGSTNINTALYSEHQKGRAHCDWEDNNKVNLTEIKRVDMD